MTNVDIGEFADVAMIVDVRRQSIPFNVITWEANTMGNVVYRTHLALRCWSYLLLRRIL